MVKWRFDSPSASAPERRREPRSWYADAMTDWAPMRNRVPLAELLPTHPYHRRVDRLLHELGALVSGSERDAAIEWSRKRPHPGSDSRTAWMSFS